MDFVVTEGGSCLVLCKVRHKHVCRTGLVGPANNGVHKDKRKKSVQNKIVSVWSLNLIKFCLLKESNNFTSTPFFIMLIQISSITPYMSPPSSLARPKQEYSSLPWIAQENAGIAAFLQLSNTGLSVFSGLTNQTLLETQIPLESLFATLQMF